LIDFSKILLSAHSVEVRIFLGISQIWEATTDTNEDGTVCQRQNYSPLNVLFSNVIYTYKRLHSVLSNNKLTK